MKMEEVINLIKPIEIINYKKKIAFLIDHFTFRGTTRACFDYANGNETILGNISVIVSPKKYDDRNNIGVIMTFLNRWPNTYFYNSLEELEKYLNDNKIEFLYMIKGGSKCEISNYFENKINENDNKIKLLIHCVYHCKDPHGYKYVAISPQVSKVI